MMQVHPTNPALARSLGLTFYYWPADGDNSLTVAGEHLEGPHIESTFDVIEASGYSLDHMIEAADEFLADWVQEYGHCHVAELPPY